MKKYLPLALFILAVAARWIPGPRTIDDSFITYRYARNLLAGEGFVYNPGERVLGTTTPFYTLVMASLGLLTGGPEAPFPLLALGLNALFDGASCVLLFWLGRRLGQPWAGLGAALAWSVAPFSVTFAIGGLETSLFVFLLLAISSAYLAGRFRLTALLSSFLLLTRPDGLLLVAPLALDRILRAWRSRSSRPNLSEALAFLGPGALWAVAATAYFGSPISHSVMAKSVAYRLPAEAAFVRLLQHYATPFLEHLTFGTFWIALGLVLYPALFLLGALKILRSEPRAWPLLTYPWIYFLAYALANPLIFRWYLTPPLPIYIFGLLAGAERLLGDLAARTSGQDRPEEAGEKKPQRAPRKLGVLPLSSALPFLFVVLTPFALSLQDWTLTPDHGLQRPAPEMAWNQLELFYREAAEFLEPGLEDGATLAASDVGVLGYFTQARILDTVGLNSPEALEYYPIDPDFYVINLATSPDLIADKQPDYLVLLEVYGRKGVFPDPRFQQSYELLKKIPTDIYTSDGMLIFGRTTP